ncbi:MAG: iron-sulfur cluster assembly scaffold protein [Pyrinomonadaceae bacterium]|nr:iron-sulfur cluster assembly scaffold protein [Pyrinomonadaceae bacterium]
MANYYPKKISKHFNKPKNCGRCEFANAVGTNASFVCGSVLRIKLQIIEQKIVDAKFQTNGCGYMISASDVLLEYIKNKQLNELNGLDNQTLRNIIETELNIFPNEKSHCLALTLETLHTAFNDFRSSQLEEFIGEKALICTCFGVTEETIENVVLQNDCETVEEVSRICNAGNGCGSCQPLIQEIIDTLEK